MLPKMNQIWSFLKTEQFLIFDVIVRSTRKLNNRDRNYIGIIGIYVNLIGSIDFYLVCTVHCFVLVKFNNKKIYRFDQIL